VGLLSVMVMVFGLISNNAYAQQSTPPANTTIGNQATATYTDNGGNQRTVTSNTVETVVQQVAGVTVSSGLNKSVSPGGTVTYPHTITNNGNGSDSFNLTAVDADNGNFDITNANIEIYPDADGNGVPDNNTPITSTPNINAGDSYGFIISANMPASATDGQFEDIGLTASSVFDQNEGNTPPAQATATNKATIAEDAVIDVQKSVSTSTAQPTDEVTFTLTFSNNGNADGTNLEITDPIPSGLTYVAGSGNWSGSGSALTDAADGNENGITYEYDNSGSQPTITAVISQLNAGASGTLEFKATVDQNTEGQTITNVADYTHDDVSGTTNTNGSTVSIDETYGVQIVGNQEISKSAVDQGATVNFDNEYTNTGSTTDTYNITIANGNYPSGTTFNLYKSDGSGNPTSPFTDTNSDGIPDTGPILSGNNVSVILQVNLPSNASGNNGGNGFTADVTLTSINDGNASDKHIDKLNGINQATVDLTNNAAATGPGNPDSPGEGQGPEGSAVISTSSNPGTTVSFTLYAKNTSSLDDNYDLDYGTSVSGGSLDNPGSLPNGWSVQFRDPNNGNSVITSTGTIAAGNSKEITAQVTIPAGASPSNQDIYFRTLSSSTGAKDIIYDQVTVQTQRNVSLTSNNTGQIFPGGSKTYTHTLTVNSNVVENDGTNSGFQVNIGNSQSGFTATVYWDENGNGVVETGGNGNDMLITSASGGTANLPAAIGSLQFGDQVKFIVKVTANTGANDGATNTTTLTISDNVGPLSDKTNEDITTVVAGLLTVDKEQAPVTNGTTGSFTKSQFNVLPGDTVAYKITVTNDGAAPVSNVSITDNTPSYTSQLGAVTASGDGSPTVASDPGDGNAGLVEVTVGTLASGESFEITFNVEVDE